MTTLLIPVGHDVGQLHPALGETDPVTREVWFGDGTFNLSDDEHFVWSLAHGSLEYLASEEPLSREQIETVAANEEVENPGAVLDELISGGAILELDTNDTKATKAFAEGHRTVPLQVGLGNVAEKPWVFATGTDDGQRVFVPAATYYLWMQNHSGGSLWQACQALAKEGRGGASAVEWETDPQKILAEFVSYLPKLVAGHSLYIDRRI